MSVYNDMANDAGYGYGSEENQQMASMIEHEERSQQQEYYEEQYEMQWQQYYEEQQVEYYEILFRRF